ncbi:hypothetical protein J437_LFUL014506 [Ladona fulva]|uniref:PiggyBac transposable element-derived protein domain-containing protein n=1 Tax=Ladona fulva TaxID=123851 RepID=A0A8K0P984_LADFU|nr:hypothetical protein J437_LFUL014506 [Ladona fulva]
MPDFFTYDCHLPSHIRHDREFLLDFIEEEKEDNTFDDFGSEGKTEVILEDEIESNSEEQASEDELPETVIAKRKDYFICKGVLQASYPKRSKSKNPKGKNICKIQPGLKSWVIDITDEASAFQKIVDGEMVEDIVKFTNLYIEHKCTEIGMPTSVTEILVLFGAVFLIAIKHGHHTNVLELWNPDGTGIIALRTIMSYRRFLFLLRCIRFDDSTTREVEKCLVQPFENENRNLTTDNWYMDYSLAHYLLTKKITLLGTIRKNKSEILSECQPNKSWSHMYSE